MVKTLILIRHAHREKLLSPNPSSQDNGLSEKGLKQAHALAEYWEKKWLQKDLSKKFYSSPKKRCIETLQPLTLVAREKFEVIECLNEANTQKELNSRILEFWKLWQSSDVELTIACSHGDWIPAFTEKYLGKSIDLDKGGWIHIEQEARVQKVIQSFT